MKTGRRTFIQTEGTDEALMAGSDTWTSVKGHELPSRMVSSRAFDYSGARKWAPNADATDLTTVFPDLPGVIPQEDCRTLGWKPRFL